MTASQAARAEIRRGVPPALAIWKAAREYGTTTKAVAKRLRAKKSEPVATIDTSDAWWNA